MLFKSWKLYRYERMMVLRILTFIRFKYLSPFYGMKHADAPWMAYLVRHSTYATFTNINFATTTSLATTVFGSSRFI